MAEHIVAAFATETDANKAERELESHGIEQAAVRRYARSLPAGQTDARTRTEEHRGGGFWAWLTGEEPHNETKRTSELYDRRAAAGNAVLSVTIKDDSKIHQVIDILNAHHPIDIDESADEEPVAAAAAAPTGAKAANRMEDTTPTRAPGATGKMPVTAAAGTPATPGIVPAGMGESATPVTPAGQRGHGGEEVIPLAEEQLEIGTRTVERGTTRVRRYVVEQPVEREVTLHGERVTVERRRPIGTEAPAGNAFEERTVEVHETEEVPDVHKTARVVEEVAVRREATERHETVRDTVRRDDVEISPDTAASSKPSAAPAPDRR